MSKVIDNFEYKTNKVSSSQYKGVSYRSDLDKYTARIVLYIPSGKQIFIHLGVYKTPEEAYIARCKYLDNLR